MSERFVATDIAIIGGGLAGTSLLAHLGAVGWTGDVTIIDDGEFPLEMRMWSWWSQGDMLLDSAATVHYMVARCASDTWVKTGSLTPFAYRTITGTALNEAAAALTMGAVHVTRVCGKAVAVSREADSTVCVVDTPHGLVEVRAPRMYDSVGIGCAIEAGPSVPRLDFVGWRVHSTAAAFTPGVMTFMDFRTDQSHGLAFVYVLPITVHDALIDHTVYVTGWAAPPIDHERRIREYLSAVCGVRHVTLVQVEEGPISLALPERPAREATQIGAAAGAVKLSTGYAFARIQRHCAVIADAVVAGEPDPPLATSGRLTRVLDRVLLGVIRAEPQAGQMMLEALVRRLHWRLLLAFLDEDVCVRDLLRLCSRVPPTVFVRAIVKCLRRKLTPRDSGRRRTELIPAGERASSDVES